MEAEGKRPKMSSGDSSSDIVVIENFINGEFLTCRNLMPSYNPSKGKIWAQIPDSDQDDVNRAVQAAQEAFPLWSNTSKLERSKVMMKIADILESRLVEFAEIESRDQGKPVSLAKSVDIPRAVYNFRVFATAILHDVTKSDYQDQFNAINYTERMPVGVAGLISPWNLPLYLLTFKVAPAIATGNCVVAKPSEMTSVTAWMLCKIFNEAGLPKGVVNVVFGTGPKAGAAIVRHPEVSLVSFTGSTATAQRIRMDSAPFSKKLSLELGGKNPCIIFKDANLEKCVPTVIRSSFANQGEICLCSSRIFVQNEIYNEFLQKFVNTARTLKVGDPKTDVNLGALISEDHLSKVRGYVKIAQEEGATILCGEGVDALEIPTELQQGYFMRPTVITDVADSSRLMQEEIFGPVVCVVPFTDEQEVISRANSVKYGLSASVWSQDVGIAHRVAHSLQAGTVWHNCWMIRDLNMPFGGMKSSGTGREGAHDSIDFFTEQKTVCIQIN